MPTEFACQVDTDGTPGVSGVDFTSTAAWWAVLRGSGGTGTLNLDSVDPWVIPGTVSGTMAPDTAVTQAVTGATGRLVYHTATQALIRTISKTAGVVTCDNSHAWYPTADGSLGANRWTPSGALDSVILKTNVRGTAADTTPWTISGIGDVSTPGVTAPLSYTNRIEVVGNFDPTAGGWDATKYRSRRA